MRSEADPGIPLNLRWSSLWWELLLSNRSPLPKRTSSCMMYDDWAIRSTSGRYNLKNSIINRLLLSAQHKWGKRSSSQFLLDYCFQIFQWELPCITFPSKPDFQGPLCHVFTITIYQTDLFPRKYSNYFRNYRAIRNSYKEKF